MYNDNEKRCKIWRVINLLFQIDSTIWRNLFRPLEYLKNLHFWPKHIMFESKKYRRVMFDAVKIYSKFGGKLTCAFKNDMSNLTNFHRLKNSDFILESKMAEIIRPNRQLDRPDAVGKLYFTLEINEWHN